MLPSSHPLSSTAILKKKLQLRRRKPLQKPSLSSITTSDSVARPLKNANLLMELRVNAMLTQTAFGVPAPPSHLPASLSPMPLSSHPPSSPATPRKPQLIQRDIINANITNN